MRYGSAMHRHAPAKLASRIAAGYVLLALVAAGIAVVLREGVPWVHPRPWLALSPVRSICYSAVLGLSLATAVVISTRATVTRFDWARRLHEELRPVARDMSMVTILVLAGSSSLGEELLFRGVLGPVLGIPLSSVLFGFLHQVRGPARWIWVAWATIVGSSLSIIFALTGSLVGPLLAHAVVNAVNLHYLREHEPGQPSHA